MSFNRFLKYKDILIIVLLALVGYKCIENYQYFFGFLGKVTSVIAPFVYALIFAYCLNPIMMLFERRLKAKRGLAVTATYLIIGGVVFLTGLYLVPSIVDSIVSITAEIPRYMDIVQNWIEEMLKNQEIYDMVQSTGILDNIAAVSSTVSGVVIGLLDGVISSLVSITTNTVKILFGFLISIYILLDKERFIREVKALVYMVLKEKRGSKLIEVTRIYHRMIVVYIGTKALDSAIIALIAFVGLFIMKAPYVTLLALVVGVTNMIPYFGPFIGEVIGFVVGAFVSPGMGLAIALFLLALQQYDAWYLEPKLIGDKVGVRPLYIILAITIGGGFFGPIGMLLASPTMATINVYYERKVNRFKAENENLVDKINELKEEVKEEEKKE